MDIVIDLPIVYGSHSAPHVIKIVCSILLGAPVGLHVLEVRDTSVVLLWEAPAFNGRTPVNGYYVDLKEASAGEEGWKAVHEKVNRVKYLKVGNLGPVIYLLVYSCNRPAEMLIIACVDLLTGKGAEP